MGHSLKKVRLISRTNIHIQMPSAINEPFSILPKILQFGLVLWIVVKGTDNPQVYSH